MFFFNKGRKSETQQSPPRKSQKKINKKRKKDNSYYSMEESIEEYSVYYKPIARNYCVKHEKCSIAKDDCKEFQFKINKRKWKKEKRAKSSN